MVMISATVATGSTIPSKIPQRKDGRTLKYVIDLQLELPFGFGNYPDKLFVSPSAELSFNSSDRELPRDMFRFKTVIDDYDVGHTCDSGPS